MNRLIFFLLFFPLYSISQSISISPIIGGGINFNHTDGETKFLVPQKVTMLPISKMMRYGVNLEYQSKKRWGASVGVSYFQNDYKLKGETYNGATPRWECSEYNLMIPIKASYTIPLYSGFRFIKPSLGFSIGYNQYLAKKQKFSIEGNVENYPFVLGNGFISNNPNEKKLDAGILLGIVVQPFKHYPHLRLGLEYNAFLMSRTGRGYFVAARTPGTNTGYFVGIFDSKVMTSNLSLNLVYDITFGKRNSNPRWRFLNKISDMDSSFQKPLKRAEPIVDVAEKGFSPYVNLYGGGALSVFSKSKSTNAGAIKYHPYGESYGIEFGVNYFFKKNIGVGLGFNFLMASFKLETPKVSKVKFYEGSFTKWKTTLSQYTFPIQLLYKHYFKQNYKHFEVQASLYAGFNQYFVFSYFNRTILTSVPIRNPYFQFSQNDDFRYSFASGIASGFYIHPFAKNVGLKFGVNLQFDFTQFNAVSYESTWSNFDDSQIEKHSSSVAPLPVKFNFAIRYSPMIMGPKKK